MRIRLFFALFLTGLAASTTGCFRNVGLTPAPVVSAVPNKEHVVLAEPAPPPTPVEIEEGFAFPTDTGGALLARRLAVPTGSLRGETSAKGPHRPKASSLLEEGQAPLPSLAGLAPRLVVPAGPRPQPSSLKEDTPLLGYYDDPLRPEPLVLAAGERVRVPGPDVLLPVPLTPHPVPATENPTLEDPTSAFSATIVRSAQPPTRTTPIPFTRFTLPAPYEHRDVIRLAKPPREDGSPVTASPRTPK